MRGKKATKGKIAPDPKYSNVVVAKFVNTIMRSGKKSVAQAVLYGAFDRIHAKTKRDPIEVFNLAIKNASPQVEVRGRRVGGANYQVPMPVTNDRRLALSMRWIISAARGRKGIPMGERLATELLDASQGEGSAIKKRDDVHKMARANRAFVHFARFNKKKR